VRGKATIALATIVLAILALGIILSVDDTVRILDALRGFVWPLLALGLVVRLLPVIAHVIESRKFEIELAGMKISVQDALDQLPRQIADLQERIVGVEQRLPTDGGEPALPAPADETSSGAAKSGRLLWVDDRPTANVFEMKALEDEGWAIDQATSTAEALGRIDGAWRRYAVVISDMGREEERGYEPIAGIQLAEAIRAHAGDLPIAIYTSGQGCARAPEAHEAGVDLVTASPIELLAFVRSVATPAS
jgi:CheY-like chemotaxis protein